MLVRKSYIPGKGYLRAIDVGAKGLRTAAMRRPGDKIARTAEERKHWEAFAANQKVQAGVLGKTSTKAQIGSAEMRRPKAVLNAQLQGMGIEGFMMRSGGKSKGVSQIVLPKNATQRTMNHEMTHAAPRRSSYRMYTIAQDGKRLMREEARAEMGANVPDAYYRNPSAPKTTMYAEVARNEATRRSTEFLSPAGLNKDMWSKKNVDEFKRVQDRIAAARQAQGKQAHESKDWKPNEQPKGNRARFYQRRDVQIGTGLGVLGVGAFKGNQYMDARRQRRTVTKSFDFLNMGGSMVEETKTIRLRDLATGKFIAGAGLYNAKQPKEEETEDDE